MKITNEKKERKKERNPEILGERKGRNDKRVKITHEKKERMKERKRIPEILDERKERKKILEILEERKERTNG